LAAEIASVLAFSAIRSNDKVGLILFTDDVEKYTARKAAAMCARHSRILFYRPKRHGTAEQGARFFSAALPAIGPSPWFCRIFSTKAAR
jgi:uncharacterized protein (DUF58 family)